MLWQWLLRDDQYMWKQTDQHNALIIDGAGQLGEGKFAFDGAIPINLRSEPRILKAASTPALDEITGDAAPAYSRASGLRRFIRRLLFIKPDVLIVVDDVELDRARDLELRFHPESRGALGEDAVFVARGSKAVLRLESLTPDGARISASDTPARDRNGRTVAMFAVRIETRGSRWRHAAALSWTSGGGSPVRVILEQPGKRWLFRAGDRAAAVNWE